MTIGHHFPSLPEPGRWTATFQPDLCKIIYENHSGRCLGFFILLGLWTSALGAESHGAAQFDLKRFLQQAGGTFGVFFTIEGTNTSAFGDNHLVGRQVAFSTFPTNIDSAIGVLTNTLADFEVTRDANRTNVYHVVQNDLSESNGTR